MIPLCRRITFGEKPMSIEQEPLIVLNPLDSVGVTRRVLRAGDPIGQTGLIARQMLPRGHKVALRDLAQGQELRKFGQVIGLASAPIHAGDHVHLHNLAMADQHHVHQFCTENHDPGLLTEA